MICSIFDENNQRVLKAFCVFSVASADCAMKLAYVLLVFAYLSIFRD